MLLTKTLRSSTLRLALICVGIFGAVVCALFGYVYLSTASYVHGRSDRAIAAEHVILRQAYDGAGRDGLVAAIGQRIADGRVEAPEYSLLARFAETLKISLPELRQRVNRKMQPAERNTRAQTRREAAPAPPPPRKVEEPPKPAFAASAFVAPPPMTAPPPTPRHQEFPKDARVGAYIATLFVYWIALANALPPLGGNVSAAK